MNRCISCGDVVPEGRQVCPNCMNLATYPNYEKDKRKNRFNNKQKDKTKRRNKSYEEE